MIKAGLKVAMVAAAVTCYMCPQLLLHPIIGQNLEGADADASARVLRGLLTLLSYGLASMRPSWFWVLVVVAALQLILWSLQLAEESLLGISVQVEKKMLLLGTVCCFGTIVGIILFGGVGDVKARFRKRLTAFYTKHNPSKLHEVDDLVEKYELNEELLFQRLHRKYNALAAGADNHSVMKYINESEFLYEEAEEESVASYEETADFEGKLEATPIPTHEKEEKEFQKSDRFVSREHNLGSGRSAEECKVIKKKCWPTATLSARPLKVEDYDELDGTPPVSPRTAEKSAYKHRQSSARINDAIEIARRAQQERIERRIANIASKSGDGYAGH